jgi:hypothetical protein
MDIRFASLSCQSLSSLLLLECLLLRRARN